MKCVLSFLRRGRSPKADLLRSLRLCTAEGVMAMPIVTMSLPVNVFMTALLAKAFVLPMTTIGLISALPFMGNFLQIFVAPFLARWRPPKIVMLAAAALHMVSWAALGALLPLIPRDDPAAAGRWLIAWFLTTSCFGAIAGVSWNAWIQDWVPYRIRGKYFGRRNATLQISTLAFLLIAGWSLAHWSYAIPTFQIIIAGAVLMRVFSLHWQWISPARPRKASTVAAPPLRAQLDVVLGSRSLLGFIAFGPILRGCPRGTCWSGRLACSTRLVSPLLQVPSSSNSVHPPAPTCLACEP